MAEEERNLRGFLGLWPFPILNRVAAAETEKRGTEGFINRTLEKAPGFIIKNAGKTAGAIAGSAAKEAVEGGLTGFLAKRPGIILK